MDLIAMGKEAKMASYRLSTLTSQKKDDVLAAMAKQLCAETDAILIANRMDMEHAQERGLALSLQDRLLLTNERIQAMADGLLAIRSLPDPIGNTDKMVRRPNGLMIGKRRVPLGVIGMIYEARPNVTADAIGLCVKSGNSCILRGGSEAIHSNLAIARVLQNAAYGAGYPRGSIHIISDTERETTLQLMQLTGYVDVLIPRGGAGLIQSVLENAKIPVIETGIGNCHAFVDASADIRMTTEIVLNGKIRRPSVCNALETLLVHRAIAGEALPAISKALSAKGVELRCHENAIAFCPDGIPAREGDFFTEFLDLILAVKIVDSLSEAIDHINRYGTGHSEVILTKDYTNAQRFLEEIDAAVVYVNADSGFTDGFEFGLGAEIGISTQKLHARGPMGLKELTSYKYMVYGDGQVRR